MLKDRIVEYKKIEYVLNISDRKARLVELVDTSDLKSDSFMEYRFKSGNE